MWPLAAAGIASLASLLELLTSRRRPPPWRAWHWVLLRLAVDGLVGLIAYPAVKAAIAGGDGIAVAITAGLAGPAVLRATIAVERPAGETAAIGLEQKHRQFTDWTNERINQLGATSDSEWVEDTAVPALAALTPDELSRRIETYFLSLDGAQGTVPPAVQEAVDDASQGEVHRRRRVVHELLATGHRVCVRHLMHVAQRRELPP